MLHTSQPIHVKIKEGSFLQAALSAPTEASLIELSHTLVIMCHGFPGHKAAHNNIFGKLTKRLNKKGYHCLSFDFRGCGESEGKEEEFTLSSAQEDLYWVMDWAKSANYDRFIFIAEGLGAALTLQNFKEDVLCLVHFWPMLDIPKILHTAFKMGELPPNAEIDRYYMLGQNRIGLDLISQLKNLSLLKHIQALKTPLMIMHGAKDEASPIDQIDLLRQHAGVRRIEITSFDDGDHGLRNPEHREIAFYHILQFIEKYV